MTGLQAWWRFHGRPGGRLLATSVRTRPGLFTVAGFLPVVWTSLAAAGLPLVRLPSDPLAASVVFTAATALAALVLAGTVGAASTLRVDFFAVGLSGERQRRRVGRARAGLCWAAAALVLAVLTGAGWASWASAALTGPAFAWALGAATLRGRSTPRIRGLRLGWPGPLAWWSSVPETYLVPFALWVCGGALIQSGSAGFAWSDRLPVNDLLLAFGWPAVLAFGALNLPDRLPYRLFRAVRAPWRRVAVTAVGPVAVQSAVAGIVAFGAASDPVRGLALASVCVTGAAFWTLLPLRFPTAGLLIPAVGVLVFVGGASALEAAAPAWAAGQGAAALVLAAGWKTRYEEGEADADH